MRTIRVYCAEALASGQTLFLDEQASQHLSRVLRLPVGSVLELFNGDGHAYQAQISALGKKQVQVQVLEQGVFQPASPLYSEIAVAISKADKVDWIVQKATELGVNCISPVLTQRCDVKFDAQRGDKKQQRWQQIMLSACEQSGRNDVVQINEVKSFADWLKQCQSPHKVICHPRQARPLAQLAVSGQIAACFGPEGGFSEAEIQLALANGFQPISLGPRILRAETAPIAALAIMQQLWGDY